MGKDYYNILGVSKEANDSEIKKAYRKLSKEYHPDLNPDNKEAEEKFKEIAEAYEVLSDSEKRSNYDRFGTADGKGNPFNGMNMDDLFANFFNGGNPFGNKQQNRRRKGSDIRINMKMTLEDIFNGVHKRIKYQKQNKCVDCNNTGGETIGCVVCGGHGIVNQIHNTPFGRMQNTTTCGNCHGSGETLVKPCTTCNGSGVKVSEIEYEFDVPRGVMDGEMLRVNGMGNSTKNGIDGDLVINIVELPHQKFRRAGIDVHQTINLTYKDLVLGNENVMVDTLEGKIKFKLKKGTDIGSMLRLPNKGFVRGIETGDMILEVWLNIPKNLSKEEEEKINNLDI
jgi:molecular chaperone DnaJ